MKRLLLSSLVLLIFSASILIFQMSCQKSIQAQNSVYVLQPATTSSLGGIIVGNGLSINSSGILSTNASGGSVVQTNKILYQTNTGSLVIADNDGTNAKNIAIPLPSGSLGVNDVMLSPEGQRIYYTFSDDRGFGTIASCKIDTSDMKIVARNTSAGSIYLKDVR